MELDKIHLNIKRERERKGLTQEAMADSLNIARTTYISFETGKTNIFSKTLTKFAQTIGRSEEEIVFGTKPSESLLEQVRNTDEKFQTLKDEYEKRYSDLANEKVQLAKEIDKLTQRISEAQQNIEHLQKINSYLLRQLDKYSE